MPRMTFKLFKKYAIAVVLAIGVTACMDMTGDSSNKTIRPTKFGKTFRSKSRRGTDLAARTLLGAPTPSTTTSLFGFSTSSGNLWDRMRSDFKFPTYEDQPAVQAQIRWFSRNQAYLNRTVSRAAPYMYYIFQEVQQRNLPGELVLLPVIESDYTPFARSSAGASGLWQLMPGTARGFGARQNFWFDGRRDIYASTNAALDYLTYLHNFFGGDWLLGIAAYNTGEGNVQNAIRHNAVRDQGTTFWSLPLATATRAYVPRLLALAAIIRNPAKYGITLPVISDKPYLGQVNLDAPMKLNQAAKLADMSLIEVKQLNPGYSRNTTDPTGPHQLTLPVNKISLFKERLANERLGVVANLAKEDNDDDNASPASDDGDDESAVAVSPVTKSTTHIVKRGETLNSIASHYKVKVSDLLRWNKVKGKKLKPGSKLTIMPKLAQTTTQADSRKAEQARQTAANQQTSKPKQQSTKTKRSTSMRYTVRSGDNLGKVAGKFGISIATLKRLNHLKGNALKPGQQLIVSG